MVLGSKASDEHSTESAIQLVVDVYVRSGTQAVALEALRRLAALTHERDAGCLRFEVGVDASNDTHYIGYEVWASHEALEAHKRQPHTQEFLQKVADIVVEVANPLHVTRCIPLEPLPPVSYIISI
jgi:quinol monooxygenase YgiN